MLTVDVLKGRYVRKGAKSLPSIQIITNYITCLAKRVRWKAMPEDAASKPTSGIQIGEVRQKAGEKRCPVEQKVNVPDPRKKGLTSTRSHLTSAKATASIW